MSRRGSGCGTTRKPATPRSAAGPWRPSRSPCTPMSDLASQIERYTQELVRSGASSHTVDAYAADLRQFLEFLSPPETAPPEPRQIDLLTLREWLAGLY